MITPIDLSSVNRILLIRPCCIGDVVMATATLQAVRRRFPNAYIVWAVGDWSRWVLEGHDLLDELMLVGDGDMPVRSPERFWGFVRQMRVGNFDLVISLVRSPLMSLAVRFSGIPIRVGLDSGGRGFGYNVRVPVNPPAIRNEAEIYLDTVQTLGIETTECYVNIPVSKELSPKLNILPSSYIVINPTGGNNPGMSISAKRWLPENFANLADVLYEQLDAEIILLGGPNDSEILQSVVSVMTIKPMMFDGKLSFSEIAQLAQNALMYIGNDTGLTHFAAATGTKTVSIFGPTDPRRYSPYHPNVTYFWKTHTNSVGVHDLDTHGWDWVRDGVSVEEVLNGLIRISSTI